MTNNKSGDVFLVVKAIDTPSLKSLGLPIYFKTSPYLSICTASINMSPRSSNVLN